LAAYTLCNDGESVMIPTPMYPGFDWDLYSIISVDRVYVKLTETNNYALDIAAFEEAFQAARRTGKTIKAVLLSSPNNPLGLVYPKDQLIALYRWTRTHNLHLISDEIFALSTYRGDTPFVSIFAALKDENPHPDYVHLTYSFSKDFCLSGFRSGFFYSENADVLRAVKSAAGFLSGSNYAEWTIHKLLSDTTWVGNFLVESRQILNRAVTEISQALATANIPYFENAAAGLFLLLDFSKYLTEQDKWAEERKLNTFLSLEGKLILIHGEGLVSYKPGVFRMVFTLYESRLYIDRILNFPEIFAQKWPGYIPPIDLSSDYHGEVDRLHQKLVQKLNIK